MPIDEEDADDRLPASMADMFFALVAIVVFMLLALVPSIEAKSAAPPEPDALWRSDIRIDGREAAVLVADGTGLRLIGPPERAVALDAVLDDAGFASDLGKAAAERPLLLAVASDGQEAAFLFDTLASSLGIGEIRQVRIDALCGHVAAADLKRYCPPRSASRAAS